jgi:hypothetical protein
MTLLVPRPAGAADLAQAARGGTGDLSRVRGFIAAMSTADHNDRAMDMDSSGSPG